MDFIQDLAGIIGGLALTSSRIVESMIALPSAEVILTFDIMITHFGYAIGTTAIFGGIFGIIYSKLYGGILGKARACMQSSMNIFQQKESGKVLFTV